MLVRAFETTRLALRLYIVVLCLVLVVTAISGCNQKPPPPAASSAPADVPPLHAELMTIHPTAWPTIVRAQGSIGADEMAVVGSRVAGRVATVHVDLGDVVSAGDQIVTLDPEEFQLQLSQVEAQLAQAYAAVGLKTENPVASLDRENSPPARQAKAVWNESKANLARTRQLYSQNAITDAEFEQVATAERVAEAQYASALNSVSELIAAIGVRSAERALVRQRLQDTVVIAPFEATVHQRHVAPGSYVQVGQALISIVRTSRLRFRATMPERHVQRIAIGQEVRLRIESMAEPRIVYISRISPVVDELSRALLFEADLDNSDGQVRTGIFAEAEVVLDAAAQTLAVPAESVIEFAGVEKVWKVVDGMAQEQVVRTGQRRENRIQILDGVAVGDLILLDASQGRSARVVAANSPPDADTTSTAGEAELAGRKADTSFPLPSTE